MLKKLSSRIWLSTCGALFGIITIFQGLTQNYSGILVTRFFLGLFECGMFPGCFYLLGMWYKRNEAQKRFTFFFCSTSLGGAFGGLLASAIGESKFVAHQVWGVGDYADGVESAQWTVFAATVAGAGYSLSKAHSPL